MLQAKPIGVGIANNAYYNLGSHLLAVLLMLFPDTEFNFSRQDSVVGNGQVESGMIQFTAKPGWSGTIHVGYNHPQTVRVGRLIGSGGELVYNMMSPQPLIFLAEGHSVQQQGQFDERKTLALAIDYFYNMLKGRAESNLPLAIKTTEILHSLHPEIG
ncbi:hypothetical protein HZB07_02900 [Candidatus Saganbacteria bacterium]|nr:hypothetical protein [Candidatus Saganbacteria bacterium]